MTMEWATVQHLDLRHAGGRRGASARPLQPHAAAFRASQAIVAVAIGTHVVGTSGSPARASLASADVGGFESAAADLSRTALELD